MDHEIRVGKAEAGSWELESGKLKY